MDLGNACAQALSVISRDEKCDDLPESPNKRKMPSRCTTSNLNGLPNDRPEEPAEQMCDSGTGDGLYRTSAASYISVNRSGSVQLVPCQQTYQTITMTNGGNLCHGTPMMQYAAHSRDGAQTYIMPDDKVMVQATTGDMSAYQICCPTSGLSQEMGSSPGSLPSPQQLSEEASRKREFRLMKNREAAKECRRRKKEYVQHLETSLTMMENQNKKLKKELEYLKRICTGMPGFC